MRTIVREEDMRAAVRSAEGTMALFYAPWCPYCRVFLPVFRRAAAQDPRFALVDVDALPFCEEAYGIDVVPTVLWLKDGRVARRLDGVAGSGLQEQQLIAFVAACGA